MLTYQFGDIILVLALLDPQGRNPKNRPVVVLGAAVDADDVARIEVMAITTWLPDPLPEDHFLLPWQIPAHPRTSLNKRCAAVGSWLATIPSERIIRRVDLFPAGKSC